MAMTYEQAVQIQRRHEARLLALPGVGAVGAKLVGDRIVLAISVDPQVELPAELSGLEDLEGLPVVVERTRYELQ